MKPLSEQATSRIQKWLSDPDLSGSKYRLISKLGSGGMAEVYLVYDSELERNAALKVIHPFSGTGNEEVATRMRRETKVIAQLEHPGIVPVHEAGILPDGRAFYVMKYVQGERLDVHAVKILNLPDRLVILQKICDAISFAHSRGVIHRDLKPQNIMVGAFGEVQVMDWGIAKVMTAGDSDRDRESVDAVRHDAPQPSAFNTDTGTIMGTPGYMAPEQGRGELSNITEKSDIYSLGAILYFLLTFSPPQRGIRPSQLNPRLPRALEAICMKALSERPEDRYATVHDLSADIHAYLNGLPMIAYKENVFERLARWTARNSFFVLLLLAYLLMRVVVFLFTGR